jgi:hypothetical protein
MYTFTPIYWIADGQMFVYEEENVITLNLRISSNIDTMFALERFKISFKISKGLYYIFNRSRGTDHACNEDLARVTLPLRYVVLEMLEHSPKKKVLALRPPFSKLLDGITIFHIIVRRIILKKEEKSIF